MEKKIVIIGAGPTGLGAGYRLKELGYSNFEIYDSLDHAGGLASSYNDSGRLHLGRRRPRDVQSLQILRPRLRQADGQ